ncbi:MAG TPA: arginine--tRNA ligase [Candidatus Acidoferrum sp.]|nr:arginine--tRNA ligase [Candidatus Acidoferrum sp.]
MYKSLDDRFRGALQRVIRERYDLDVPVVTERPRQLSMGEIASPVCFELAKRLKKAPRAIAQEIAAALPPIEGFARVEVAGGGYLNAFLDRASFFRAALQEAERSTLVTHSPDAPKVIVEHTSINPNKAAHIGHLRNAVLGDTFARLLRYSGRRVEVQNYIDNTGVQVADVVLGFLHVEPRTPGEVRALADEPKFDYVCWDLYTRVTQWLAEDKSRLELRAQTLPHIEEGRGEAAKVAEVVSTAIVRCHLRTLDRLGISYDLLSRESEILRLKFWDAAFEMLKKSGAIQYATSGKNAGCWVMQLPSDKEAPAEEAAQEEPSELAEAKIIVRSNGTVTYVGKDIAYHLWKFGLLGRDFHYRRFEAEIRGPYPWITASESGDPDAPAFGHAHDVFNVIDARQAYPQQVVAEGLRALGYTEQADRLKHFSYNVVALTPRCAEELGYEIPPEDAKKPYIEVSGRKGQGVKADDLIDQLEMTARAEVEARHPELVGTTEYHQMVNFIAVGALRYFLLRFTRSTVIAFDFKDALSFEGETGPYAQYAVVRVNGIVRKGTERLGDKDAANLLKIGSGEIDSAKFLTAPANDDLWDVALLAGSLDQRVDAAVGAQEPAFLARYAFELAQAFNAFYHKHPILSEEDAEKRAFLLRLTQLVKDQLVKTLDLLGIKAPERM